MKINFSDWFNKMFKKNEANATKTFAKTEGEVIDDTSASVVLSKKDLVRFRRNESKPIKNKARCSLVNHNDNIIEVKEVVKYYLSGYVTTPVLKGVDLEVKKGEFVVLFGKSGSGKSTLLNLMSGLDRPSEGDVVVVNQNLTCQSDSQLTNFRRKHVSFIFQSYNLFQNLSGYDNVLTGAYLQKDKNKLLNIDDLFKEFEIEEIKNKYPSQMSGGQQQRISILRALIKNSDIIFADEPTGALDENTSKIVLRLLQYINKKYQTTIVMVSHDPSVAELANKVIYLENGLIKKIKLNEKPKQI
ncbi:ABC transporter ATP-binding protein [Candidatus Mycoplasma pogonae]